MKQRGRLTACPDPRDGMRTPQEFFIVLLACMRNGIFTFGSELLAVFGFSKNEPVAMPTPAVVGYLPLGVDDGPLSDFNNAVAWHEACVFRGLHEFHVRPLIAVVVDVIRNLGEKKPLIPQHAMSFFDKRGKGVRESVSFFLGRFYAKPKPSVEVLQFISALVWDVWRVVNDDIEK